MLESDVTSPNQRLWVQFYPGKIPNEARSRDTGKPEFDLVDFVRIAVPGDPTNVVERPARESDQREWPQQWAAYKAQQTFRPVNGTPVEDWPRLDVATVAKLKALEFHTVEQVADASDAQLQRVGMGAYEMRDRARAFLKTATDSALAQKQADELRIKDQEISDLRDMLKESNARIEALERKQSRKRDTAEA